MARRAILEDRQHGEAMQPMPRTGGHTADVCPTSTEKRCSRCNGRGHSACVCPSSKEEAVLAATSEVGERDGDGEDGTVQASAFKAEETDDCGDGLGRMGEGELTWCVEVAAWISTAVESLLT